VLIKSLEARVFVHATEDKAKVLKALMNVVGDTQIVEEDLTGYFGNPIIVLTAASMKTRLRRSLIGYSRGSRRLTGSTCYQRLTRGSLRTASFTFVSTSRRR